MTKSRFINGELLIILSALIWGVAFYFQKTAMSHIGPLFFIGLRGALAALTLLPFAYFELQRKVRKETLATADLQTNEQMVIRKLTTIGPVAVIGGATFFVAAVLQQAGLITATVTNTGFLTALYVVVTPFLFWIIRRKRPGNITWCSAAIALTGVWALGDGSLTALSSGDKLVALSSLFWGLLIVISGQAGKHQMPMTYTAIQFFIVGCIGLLGAFLFESVSVPELIPALPAVLYVAILSTALTFGLMAVALQTVPAPIASVLLATETLFAALAGYAWLDERLTLMGWSGAALILTAVLVVQLDKRE